jgi:hypothetical protein
MPQQYIPALIPTMKDVVELLVMKNQVGRNLSLIRIGHYFELFVVVVHTTDWLHPPSKTQLGFLLAGK